MGFEVPLRRERAELYGSASRWIWPPIDRPAPGEVYVNVHWLAAVFVVGVGQWSDKCAEMNSNSGQLSVLCDQFNLERFDHHHTAETLWWNSVVDYEAYDVKYIHCCERFVRFEESTLYFLPRDKKERT